MKAALRLFSVFFLIGSCMSAHGQADSSLVKRNNDLIRFTDGFAYTLTAPARWDGKDWVKFGVLVAGTTAIALLDEPIRDYWQSQENDLLDGIEQVGYYYGTPQTASVFAGGFYLVGFIIKDEWTKDTGLALGASLLHCGLVHSIAKASIGRARPRTNEGFLSFDPFTKSGDYHAMPSGHMATAMAISTVIAQRTKSRFVKLLCYALAASTGISRMYGDHHWFSDIVLGGALGYFSADIANRRIGSNQHGDLKSSYKKNSNKISWQLSPDARGFYVVGKF
jgi:membrane-associated phospholipid phosphatase